MHRLCSIVCFFLLTVKFNNAGSDRLCRCDGNGPKNSSNTLRGLSGKRGPPGPPGDVRQCGCNTSEILEQLKSLTKQVNSYKGKLILFSSKTFFVHINNRYNVNSMMISCILAISKQHI